MQAKTQNVTFSPEGSFSATGERQAFLRILRYFEVPMRDSKLGESGETVPVVGQNAPEIRLGLTWSGFATRNDRITKVK
jgi:hypothetical protein